MEAIQTTALDLTVLENDVLTHRESGKIERLFKSQPDVSGRADGRMATYMGNVNQGPLLVFSVGS